MGAAVTSQGKVLPMKKIALAALLALTVSPACRLSMMTIGAMGSISPDSNQRPQPDSFRKGALTRSKRRERRERGRYGQPYYPQGTDFRRSAFVPAY